MFAISAVCLLLQSAAVPAAVAETPSRDEPASAVWNAAIDSYESGDHTNALRLARQLMLEKSHAGRAGELVAKLEHERGNRDEAAAAAQIALRANPESARAQRNFTRATDGLLESRHAKKVEKILKEAEGKDPGASMLEAARSVRQMMKDASAISTNAAARRIMLADTLSAKAQKLSEIWISTREAIARSATNENLVAGIVASAGEAEKKMALAAKELSDLDPAAAATLADVEHDYTRFAKLLVAPNQAIGECITAQSNAWQDVESFNSRPWQKEALDYTRSFRAKFPAWAKAYEQSAQADTNKPPFTAEAQAKISKLSTELEKLQLECVEKLLPPKQEDALKKAIEIQELLPKDKSSGNQGGGAGNQPNSQPDQKNQNENKNDDQQQNDQQQNEENNENRQDDEQQQPEEEQQNGEQEKPGEEDEKVEAILKKAQERNDEHEADKKLRMRKSPLPPNERDW
jgi:hypothetical protein